jgi:hypothetical protein
VTQGRQRISTWSVSEIVHMVRDSVSSEYIIMCVSGNLYLPHHE